MLRLTFTLLLATLGQVAFAAPSSLESPVADAFAAAVPTSEPTPAQTSTPDVRHAIAQQASQVVDHTSALVATAMSFVGVRYSRGGSSANTGFDCSGFVLAIYKKTAGLVLPRRARDQAASTDVIDKRELKPGDLVFFNTMRRAFSHVGVYLGDGNFVHSPRSGQSVRIDNMHASYWKRRFDGARRVALDDKATALLASVAPASASEASLLSNP